MTCPGTWMTIRTTRIAVVPFGPALCFGKLPDGSIDFGVFQGIEAVGNACQDARFSLQVADLDIGILYYFAMAGTAMRAAVFKVVV